MCGWGEAAVPQQPLTPTCPRWAPWRSSRARSAVSSSSPPCAAAASTSSSTRPLIWASSRTPRYGAPEAAPSAPRCLQPGAAPEPGTGRCCCRVKPSLLFPSPETQRGPHQGQGSANSGGQPGRPQHGSPLAQVSLPPAAPCCCCCSGPGSGPCSALAVPTRFLRYCKEKGGYTGYPFEEETPEEDSLAAHLNSLHLST